MIASNLQADFIVTPSWIVTINPDFDILEQHSLVVHAGKIVAIGETQSILSQYSAPHIELKHQALLPGFVNTHTHAAMSLLKGYAEDLPLQGWLNDHIWPTEGKWMSADFVRDGTLLACAEMLKSGTTCFNDMYFFPEVAAQVVESCGMRACFSTPILEFPSAWASNAEEYIEKGIAVHDQFNKHPLISTAFGPHAPYTVSLETLKKINSYAEELDCNIHMHLHENAQEVAEHVQAHGKSAIHLLAENGLLTPRLQAVHMTQLSDAEIELIQTYNVTVVHCPESNMKLASGIAPIQTLLKKNISVALGTDGNASNNDLDMIGEMKSAALLAKVSSGKADALNAQQALRMATIEGAKALGLEAICGSLETGKAADMIAIDLSGVEYQPVYQPVSHIIYNAAKSQVSHVWVAGKALVLNHQLQTIDEKIVNKQSQLWREKILTQ